MGGKNNRAKAERKATRARTRGALERSQQAGHGFHADPGGMRQKLIKGLWESFVSDKK